jgi:hypothetical protein
MDAIASVFRSDPDTLKYADEIYDTPGSSLISKNNGYVAKSWTSAFQQGIYTSILFLSYNTSTSGDTRSILVITLG